jgi:AcrR family transcriptional regulator
VRGEATRERFFRAALELCAEKGYYEMRMDEVVQRAGGSKGGLYHHFASKRDLFLQAFEHSVGDVQERLYGMMNPSDSAEGMLRGAFAVLSDIARDSAFVRSLVEFYVVGMHDGVIRASFFRFYQETLAFGRAVVQLGVERGEFRRDLDPEQVARALFMGGDGAIILHLALGEDERAGGALLAYLDMVLRGISAPHCSDRRETSGGILNAGSRCD